jgi:sulfur carrier protein
MNIKVNGEIREITDGVTLYDLIHSLGLQERVMAAAINMEVVKKDKWCDAPLKEGDVIELLDFVGGG